jgi:DNA-binding response OmpR family regulator
MVPSLIPEETFWLQYLEWKFMKKGITYRVASEKAKILLIEGKRTEYPVFFVGLTAKGFQVSLVSSGSEASKHLEREVPQLVLVNAPSMRTSGRRICQTIRARFQDLPIILMADENVQNIEALEANVVLVQPFTLQKLLNRIRLLLPSEEKELHQVGALQLDIEHRWAKYKDRQARLTPRLTALLNALMERPGEVFDRGELFQLVWETGYTGDTRTLDVHISWLRKALEEDARHPQFIKTVRGVGYRLDLDYDARFPPVSKKKPKIK